MFQHSGKFLPCPRPHTVMEFFKILVLFPSSCFRFLRSFAKVSPFRKVTTYLDLPNLTKVCGFLMQNGSFSTSFVKTIFSID